MNQLARSSVPPERISPVVGSNTSSPRISATSFPSDCLRMSMPWQEVASYARQLCLALQHAHEQGIIHRDLKPSNLMITRDGTVKLTDFGIAKDTDVTALTGAYATIGTAAYMSPEQCKGDRDLTP